MEIQEILLRYKNLRNYPKNDFGIMERWFFAGALVVIGILELAIFLA